MTNSKLAIVALVASAHVLLTLGISRAQHPEMNPSLLGVISAPASNGVRLLRVLEHSPADEAGLESGDVLTRVGERGVSTPEELDRALASVQPGSRVDLTWERDGTRHTSTADVIHWRNYRGAFLRGRARGDTGFEAPEWYAYAWDHGKSGSSADAADSPGSSPPAAPTREPPARETPTHENPTRENPTHENPTRENTVGKVVVIHAFQSW